MGCVGDATETKFIALEINAKRLGKCPWYHENPHLCLVRVFVF
jgi:hypothetical protein